jgi:hypothetical protein
MDVIVRTKMKRKEVEGKESKFITRNLVVEKVCRMSVLVIPVKISM